MLLQLSHYIPLCPHSAWYPYSFQESSPPFSTCPWVTHTSSSLALTFPILILTSPCLFCTYSVCFLIAVPFHPFSSHLITFQMISISMILFLFWLLLKLFRFRFSFKDLQPRLLSPPKLSIRMEGQMKYFSDKVKLKEFIITKPLLHEMLKGLI